MGVPAADAEGRPARARAAAGDGGRRRALPRAAARARGAGGARRRLGLGRDRARDRRRAPGRAGDRRSTPPPTRSRVARENADALGLDGAARGARRDGLGEAVATSSSRTHRTSIPGRSTALEPGGARLGAARRARRRRADRADRARPRCARSVRAAALVLEVGRRRRPRRRRALGAARFRSRRDHAGSRGPAARRGGPAARRCRRGQRGASCGRARDPPDRHGLRAVLAPGRRGGARLYVVKGRRAEQPTALLARDVDTLLELRARAARSYRAAAARAAAGRVHVRVPNPARRFPWLASRNPDTIGLRVPDAPEPARASCSRASAAVAATSANLPGGRDPRRRRGCAGGAPLRVPRPRRRGAARHSVDGRRRDRRRAVVLREGAVSAEETLARVRSAQG